MSGTGEAITIQELMKQLRVSNESIYRYIKAGKLRAFRVGGQWRVTPEERDRFLREETSTARSRLAGGERTQASS